MAETRSDNIIVCFFLLHGVVMGFEVEGHTGIKGNPIFADKPCVSIFVTDLEIYQGNLQNKHLEGFIFHTPCRHWNIHPEI